MSQKPIAGNEDRSKWRYEDGGPTLEAAIHLVQLLKDPSVSGRLDEVEKRVTKESWTAWRQAVSRGFASPFLNELTGHLSKVRFPADGMAYVFFPITHPDQNESILIDKPQKMYINFVTLLVEDREWRIHDIGPMMVPPQDLGRQPYSWSLRSAASAHREGRAECFTSRARTRKIFRCKMPRRAWTKVPRLTCLLRRTGTPRAPEPFQRVRRLDLGMLRE